MPPTKVKYHEVDFLSVRFSAQSTLVYQLMLRLSFFEKIISLPIEDLKYLKTHNAVSIYTLLKLYIYRLTRLVAYAI